LSIFARSFVQQIETCELLFPPVSCTIRSQKNHLQSFQDVWQIMCWYYLLAPEMLCVDKGVHLHILEIWSHLRPDTSARQT